MSFPSLSASSTIRFAIRSFTDPPADVYSTFPTIPAGLTHKKHIVVHIYSRRLHCKPSSAAIRSNLTSGVLPTASRALSRICGVLAILERQIDEAVVEMSVEVEGVGS